MCLIPGLPQHLHLVKYAYTVIGEFYLCGFEVKRAEDMDLRFLVEPAPGYEFVQRPMFSNSWAVEKRKRP